MAVAYVPAYLEDRATFIKERANGLYGPGSFLIANFLIGLPYLCESFFSFSPLFCSISASIPPVSSSALVVLLFHFSSPSNAFTNHDPVFISVLFSIITYWLCNFRPTAQGFFTWVMWLFLDLIAAESLVVFMSSIFPVFVIALALTAFMNGLWMSVGGFLVSPKVINVFWRYWARYIDYQAYVFQGMMVNEFSERTYDCSHAADGSCVCMYQTALAQQCLIPGQAVLDTYGYEPGHTGEWVGILLSIVLVYRLLTYLVLRLKRT